MDQSDTKLSPDANGVYQVLTNRAYKLRALFDFRGITMEIFKMVDFFKLEVPAEITFYDNHDVELVDLATNDQLRMHILKSMEITKVGRLRKSH